MDALRPTSIFHQDTYFTRCLKQTLFKKKIFWAQDDGVTDTSLNPSTRNLLVLFYHAVRCQRFYDRAEEVAGVVKIVGIYTHRR